MKKLVLFTLLLSCFWGSLFAQEKTVEQLKAEKAEKAAQIEKLQGEVNALQTKIDQFPGWKFGGLGVLGFNVSQFNDWFGSENPNARNTSIGLSANGFANLDRDKYFWRNSASLVYTRTKLIPDSSVPNDQEPDFETTADALNASSLYGYKLTDKFAISALGEYRSFIDNFNDPGYLDIGVGATWTPITNLVVVVHPLNYNFVFANDDVAFNSSLGAKVVADYTRSLPMGIAWKSNFSAFVSYEDLENLSNWTWINGFSYTLWKGFGVGFDFGLRQNGQEALGAVRAAEEAITGEAVSTFEDLEENPLQTYWLLGITYAF